MLRLADKWVWDSWYVRSGDTYHAFYLQAPRTLPDPGERHWHASIGHAVSPNLRDWQVVADAVVPGRYRQPPGAGDDPAADSMAAWTGSVLAHDGRWYLFYTGISRADGGRRQQICLATSNDLMTWRRHTRGGLLAADPRWYEVLGDKVEQQEAWRDPWVFRCAEDGLFHMFVTARANSGAPDERAVIGHAVSANLTDWEVLPPVHRNSRYAEMEVPQLAYLGGRYYLLFCLMKHRIAGSHAARLPHGPASGIHYLVSDSPLGPFVQLDEDFWLADPGGSYFAGRLVDDRRGNWRLMAFRQHDAAGRFVGELIDPVGVTAAPDGRLLLDEPLPGT